MSFDRMHLHHCMLYEFDLGHSVAEATRNLCQAMGEGTVHRNTVSIWFARFMNGDRSLEDQPRSGRPAEVDLDALRALVESDPTLTTRCMGETLGFTHQTIINALHKIGKVSKLGRYVPHELSVLDRQSRKDRCLELLSRSRTFAWLERLVCGDEKWVIYTTHSRKRQWCDVDEEPKPTPKGDLHPRKVMLSLWWDVRGVILWELLPPNAMITSASYCAQLQRLKARLEEVRPRHGCVIFQHDNARPHTAKITRDTLQLFGWELIAHPAYSPDLAPTDYHIFRSLANHLEGKSFDDRKTLEADLQHFFYSKPVSFYSDGIRQLPTRWQHILDHDGDYYND